MESFWESLWDLGVLLAKVLIVAVVVRTCLFFLNIQVYFPIIDPAIDYFMSVIGGTASS